MTHARLRSALSYAPHWGTVLSCLLYVGAFPPWDLHYLIWICLMPWLYSLSRVKSLRAALVQGLWLSSLIGITGFPWVAYVLHEFGNLPWPISIVCLLLYSWANQPQLVLLAPIVFAVNRERGKGLFSIVALSLFYVGTEAILPKLFKDTLGHALYASPWLRQTADLGGVGILSFVIAFFNFSGDSLRTVFFKTPPRRFAPCSVLPLGLAFLMIAAMLLYGRERVREVHEWMSQPHSAVRASLIQADIGDFDKLAAKRGLHGASEKVLGTYFDMSDQALALQNKPDFLVWPETAYPSTFRKPFSADDYAHDHRMTEFARSRHTPLLFGGYDRDAGKDFNAFFFLSPEILPSEALKPIHSDGNDLEFYRKSILLMFGEYVPFHDLIPGFDQEFSQIGNFGRGIGPDVLAVPIQRLGSKGVPSLFKVNPLICYEVLYSDYVLAGANQGSQAMLNITNDSWFGPLGEPYLHLALSIFRSVETRLPLIRSTNTGFSALVLPDGEMADKSDLFHSEIVNVEVPLLPSMPTLIKRWGNWFERYALWLGIAGVLLILTLGKFGKRVQDPVS